MHRYAVLRRGAVVGAMLVSVVAAPATSYAADPRHVRVTLASVASTRLTEPTVVTSAGDARLFVAEKRGVIRVVAAGRIQSAPYLDLRRLVGQTGGEQGLLGLAFSPTFARDRSFYVTYNNADGSIQLTRFRATTAGAATASFTSRVPLLTIPHAATGRHNGGMLAFGPDAMLYLSTGDGGSTPQTAQDLGSLLGKILRIDVRRACLPARYCIPAGNPFASTPGARQEIWHLGFRNPWRFSFDRVTGSMWIGDVGNAKWEEIDTVPPGVGGFNFGWSCREAAHAYTGRCRAGPLAGPVDEYGHADGSCAVTGGYVYRGRTYPALAGLYVFADICSLKIWAGRMVGGRWLRTQIGSSAGSITSFGESSTGELYAVDLAGRISQITARAV